MINCTLTDKQLEILRTKIAKDLLNYVNTGDIFSLKDYVRSMYDRVYALKGNQNLAIDYARMTLSFVKQLWGVDSRFEDLNGLDVSELATQVKQARDEKKGFENVAEFIDAEVNLNQQLGETKKQLEKEEDIKKFQQQIRTGNKTNVFSGNPKPSSPLTTTINEYIEGDAKLGLDPEMAYYTKFVHDILDNFIANRVSSDPESGIEYPGVEGGLFVTLVRRNTIPLDQQYKRVRNIVSSGVERDNVIKYYNEAYSYVITNSKGEPVQFDDRYNVVENGKYIHYNARPLPFKKNNDFVLNTYAYVQSIEEIAKSEDITEEEATERLTAQLNALEKLYKYVDSAAGNKVVFSIAGGSYGGLGTQLEYQPLSAVNFKNQTVKFEFRSNVSGFTGFVAIPSRIGKPMSLKIGTLSEEDIDYITNLITEKVLGPDGKEITGVFKQALLSNYIQSSIKDFYYAVNTSNGEIFFKYGGNKLSIKNKDEVRNAIANTIGGPKRKYNVNLDNANNNSDVLKFKVSPDPRTGVPVLSYEKVSYQDFLSSHSEIQVDIDDAGTIKEINPYFSLVPMGAEIAKAVLNHGETVKKVTEEKVPTEETSNDSEAVKEFKSQIKEATKNDESLIKQRAERQAAVAAGELQVDFRGINALIGVRGKNIRNAFKELLAKGTPISVINTMEAILKKASTVYTPVGKDDMTLSLIDRTLKEIDKLDRNNISESELKDVVDSFLIHSPFYYQLGKSVNYDAELANLDTGGKAKTETVGDIYSQLGSTTQTPNVVISNIKTKSGKYDREANIKEAEAKGRIYSMETASDLSFSNPWAHFNRKGTIKTETTEEAVRNYIDWLTTDKFKDVKPERREWILNQLKSGELKGKAIQYYVELNEPSHVTALDYLINKYDWGTQAPVSRAPITEEEIPITAGRYVKYKDEYFIVTKLNDNGTVQIYNPTKSGTAAKKSVSPKNLTATKSEAKVITYKDTDYLVTNKGEIISLKSNKKMEWAENDGNRVAIMELAGAPKPAEVPAPIQEVIEKGKKSRTPRARRSSADSDILGKITGDEEWFNRNKNKLNIQSNFAATAAQIQDAKTWYEKSPLSKKVPFKVMFNAINTRTKGSIATWTTSGITLFQGSDYSDLYHEAWHAFTQMFMTEEQRTKMYKEAGRATGSFKTFEGNIVKFSEANDLELEEYLAEDFREFMLGKKVSETTPVKSGIFQWLLDLLRALFGKTNTKDIVDAPYSVSAINELYNKLKVGDLVGYTFNQNNAVFTTLNKVVEATNTDDKTQRPKLGYEDSRMLGKTVDALFGEIIDQANATFNTKIYTAKYLLDPTQRTIAYEYVREQLGYRLEDALVDREEATDLEDIEALDYEIDTLTYALNNFGDPANLSKPTGLIKYHMETSKFLSFEDKLLTTEDDSKSATEPTKNEFEAKSGNEQSMQALASPVLLYTIYSLYSYDKDGEVETNLLGFPELADFNRSWNRIVNVTDGSRNINDVYAKLKAAENDYPVIKQFLSKVGSPDTLDGASQGLWSEINKVLTMSRVPLAIFSTEVTRSRVKTDPSDPNDRGKYTVSVEFRPTIAGGEYRKVGMRWDSDFAMRSPDEFVKVNPISNTNELMVDKVLEKFKFVNENNVFEFMEAIGMPLENNKTVLAALKDRDTGILKDIRDIHFTLGKINDYNIKFSKGNPIAIYSPTDIVKDHFRRMDDGKVRPRTSDKTINASLAGSSNKYQSIQKFHLKWSDDFSDTTVSNAEGENQYEKSKRSTVINNIEDINAANNLIELTQEGITDGQDGSMNHLDIGRNPFMKTSMFMDAIFDEKGNKRSTSSFGKKTIAGFQLLNMAGTSVQVKQIKGIIDRSGVASSAADDTTKTMQDYYMMMLYGVSEAVRHADKSTTYLYRLMQADPKRNHLIELIDFANVREEGMPSLGRTKFVAQMVKYLSSEYERIQKLKDGDEAGTTIVGKSTYAEEGSTFKIFDKILTTETKNALQKYRSRSLANPIRTSEQFLEQLDKDTELKNTVEQEISAYLTQKIKDFTTRTADLNLFTKSSLVEPVIRKVAGSSTEYYSNMSQERKNQIADSLAEAYIANSWLQNYETVLMFYGDPALYKDADDFFKRDAGISATGDTPRTDVYMQNYINKELSEISYAAKKGIAPKQWGHTMNSAVLQDVNTRSTYINEYKDEAIKKEKARLKKINASKEVIDEAVKKIEDRFEEAYGKMTEGDGQGWINFDAYRSLLKSMNKWSSYQEALYRKIVNGESVDTAEVLQFFPVKKMQYWGVLKTGGLPVYGFHKFSLMPMIPSLVEGTGLGYLQLSMLKQGIDYALLQSGSKINTITKDGTVDKFYNDNSQHAGERTLAIADPGYTFTKNTIFTKYFKDQLEVHDHFSNKVTFSTQMRKLIEEGLMEDGVPSDWRPDILGAEERVEAWEKADDKEKLKSVNYRKILVYESNINKLVELKKEQLKKEIGTDKKALVKFIKKELERSDKMSEHELEFIDYDAYTNDLKNALELSLSVDQIEKLLVGIVQKRIISQKVRGEALVQVSNVGFDKFGFNFEKPTEAEIARYGRDDLPFYKTNMSRWEEYLERTFPGVDNKKTRSEMRDKMPKDFASGAMKVKIALQGDFKKLLNLPDVLQLSVDKNISRLDALNQLIKDENWLDGRTDPIFKAAFAQLNSTKGDTKLFVLKSELTDEIKALLTPDTKGGLREKGKEYYGIKVLGDYYTHKTLKSADGDNLDIIVVDSAEDAQRQLDEYIKGGAKQFVDVSPVDIMGSSKRDLITMAAARIPVQGLNSMEFMEVYEFLPEAAGNIVILPAEIVAKSGGDFDIDKMFTIMPNIISNFRTESDETLNELEKEFGRRIDRKEIKAIEDKFENEEELTEEEENIVNYINEFGKGEFYVGLAKGNNVKGIENQLLKNTVGILSMPDNFSSLVTPNGIDIIKPAAEDMAEAVRGEKKGSKASPTEIFELERNLYKHQSNNIGKTILGIIAVNNTFNVIFNRVGMRMSPKRIITETEEGPTLMDQVLYLPHNTINGNISLSGAYAADQATRISDVINQMINGAVDVAKDAWIFDIQGNKEVISSLIFLLQAGVPVDQAIYFVSQPLIREYIKLTRQNKSKFSVPLVDKDFGTYARTTARDKILTDPKYGFGFTESDLLGKKKRGSGLDKTTVFAALDPIARSGNFDKDVLKKNVSDKTTYSDNDRAAFAHFVQIQEMANHITAVTQGLNFDTTKTSTLFDARAKLANLATLGNGVPEDVIQKIINESPIGAFKIQDFISEQYHELFPLRDSDTVYSYMEMLYVRQPDGRTPISDIKKALGLKSGREGDEKFQRLFRNDLISFIFQSSYYKFDPNSKVYKGKDTSFDIQEGGPLSRGAVVKDGKLYIDIKTLKNQYSTGVYSIDIPVSGESAWKNLFAPVAKETFQNENQYVQFVYERETLRSYPENSFENISKTKEYANYVKESAKTGESAAFRAYESVLRDRALDNLNFHGHLFNGPRAYARQVLDLKVTNPGLFKKYAVLDNLEGKTLESQSNLKFSNTMLKGDDYSIYAQNLKDLANESIKKSNDPAENLRISKLFQKFPLYAFLQSGVDTSSSYSMVRAVSSTDMLSLTKEPYENFLDILSTKEAIDQLDIYQELFMNQYSTENKYNANKIKNYVPTEDVLKYRQLKEVYNLDPSVGVELSNVVDDESTMDTDLDEVPTRSISINDVNIDLGRIGIDFTPNDQQVDALDRIGKFLDSDETEFTLMGYAGTGKTSITKILLEYLRKENLSVTMTAPTNKAKTVITSVAGKNAKTIFKALGLKPMADANELDLNNLVFDPNPSVKFKSDVLIVDETSFVSDKLHEVIKFIAETADAKIIYIGDPAQLKPPKQNTISDTFNIKNKVELTKVERQAGSNPLGPILDGIRSNINGERDSFEHKSAIQGNEGIVFTDSSEKFIENAVKAFTSDNFKKNKNFVRIVTYLNERIPELNRDIRAALGYTQEYVPGELLMAYTNLGRNRSGDYDITNSMDYVVSSVKYVQEKDVTGYYTGQALMVSGYDLVVQDLNNPKEAPVKIFMLAKDNPPSVFAELGKVAEALYKEANLSNRYDEYNSFLRSIGSPRDIVSGSRKIFSKVFDYAYTHSIHKSQGSTYTNIFVDFPSIENGTYLSNQDKNQLKYVALSRATNMAYVMSSGAKGLSPDIDWNMPFNSMKQTPRAIVSAKTTATEKQREDLKTLDKVSVVRDPLTGINYFKYVTVDKVPVAGIFNESFMELLKADYPNGLFIRNEAVDGGNSTGNNTAFRDMGNQSMGIFSKKGTNPAKIGAPKITNDGWTDATLEENKKYIDESIQNILKEMEKNPGMYPVFDFNGYGQYLIGYNELSPFSATRPYEPVGKETFLYLSEQLFRNFGYINPHYMEFTQGKKTVQKMAPVSDEELIENFKQCYKNSTK